MSTYDGAWETRSRARARRTLEAGARASPAVTVDVKVTQRRQLLSLEVRFWSDAKEKEVGVHIKQISSA